MSQASHSPPTQPRVLEFWQEGEVWFRDAFPEDSPWSDETLLEQVPESALGQYGVKAGEYATVDGQRYEPGQYVVVGSREELRQLVMGMGKIEGVVFPWFDRLVPPALWLPHQHTIDLASYRKEIGSAWVKALAITVGLVGLGFAFPNFKMLALLGATIYGLFPLVQNSMAWLRRVDQYSVRQLNQRMVNGELFRRWILGRSTRDLKIALGVIIAIFLGQMLVDGSAAGGRNSSIAAAALVKGAVLEQGEWWRTVTTGLMHGSILHILFNGMALYSLGRVLIAFVSPSLLSLVFLVTVFTGSLASLYLGPPQASVGASGGILGCLGFLLVVTLKFRDRIPSFLSASLIQSTIVVSIFGFLGAAFIDNAAHGGGFLGGVLIGIACYPWLRLAPERVSAVTRIAGWASNAVLLAAAAKVAWELYQVVQ